MENSQGRNGRNKQIINTYLNEQYHGIKRTDLCGSENSVYQNQYSPNEHEQKLKTWMGN